MTVKVIIDCYPSNRQIIPCDAREYVAAAPALTVLADGDAGLIPAPPGETLTTSEGD
jgi:hypothetical protein